MSDLLQRYRVLVVSLLAVAIAAGAVYFLARRPQPAPITISTPIPSPTPVPTDPPTPAPLRVYVTGAVRRPDVYLLPPMSIVKDAVAAAGGPTADADLERINLALQLVDQQQIYVPRQGEDVPPVVAPANPGNAPAAESGPIDINTATLEELDTLPGVGPAIAQRIIDYRNENGPFGAIEEIMNVKGIGPATFEKFKDQIAVR